MLVVRGFLTVIAVIILTFFVMISIPGNPLFSRVDRGMSSKDFLEQAEKSKEEYSFSKKFTDHLQRLILFDFGRSLVTGEEISKEIWQRMGNTLILTVAASFVFIFLGVGGAVLSAMYPGSVLDYGLGILTAMMMVSPVFWFGLILILIFSHWLNWFAAISDGTLSSLILPALTVGLRPSAFLYKILRKEFSRIMAMPYIAVARSKGLCEFRIVFFHALANAMISVITVIGIEIGNLLTGAVVAEVIFSWKGIGSYLVLGIQSRDYSIILASVYVTSLFGIFASLCAEATWHWLDPRISRKGYA